VTLIGHCAVSVWGSSVFHRISLIVLLAVACFANAENATLPPGPMQAKVKAACTQCHAASKLTSQHKTRQEWNDQLDKMVGLGANVPDEDRKAFLNYLTKNFGPGNKLKTVQKTQGAQ
jgi:viroplasmin and RNaseH domain-containing protein